MAPRLSFFTELDAPALVDCVSARVLALLAQLRAGVSMGMRDLSPQRANTMRALNERALPVTAWVLLPKPEGYFATADNVELVERRCDAILEWARAHDVALDGLGLDFEPPLHELEALLERPFSTLANWYTRARRLDRFEAAHRDYSRLVKRLQRQGLRVESYQSPFALDDRRRASTSWQRFASAMNVDVDREVTMLYSSLFGRAVCDSFRPQARSIAVGSTGGGVDPLPKLDWARFERDLRLAARVCDEVSIFSLEGCVEQAFLERLPDFDWSGSASESSARHAVRVMRELAGLVIR